MSTPKQNLQSLKQTKVEGRRFATLTAYDATFARIADDAGVECLLVGDSLGNVIQGQRSTVPVTLEHMVYHTECVARGCERAFLMTDMPFMSYSTPDQAIQNATRLMQAGAQMVKLEGQHWLAETLSFMSERGVPLCGHLGLLPQSVDKTGGYRVQGSNEESASKILNDAISYTEAGVDILLLECVPAALAKRVREAVDIPVIGIGAGPHTDSQVLVLQDLLGISPRMPSFAKNYMANSHSISEAIATFVKEVQTGSFPNDDYCIA